ncbi:MAG: hypothetical protein ACLTPN_03375 [Clostridia bacterium]
MNENEEKIVNEIIDELKEIEIKETISLEKKAYYVYRRLGEFFNYNESYMLADNQNEEEYEAKKKMYYKGTDEKGTAICVDMNKTCVEALKRLGIEAHLAYTEIEYCDPLSHADGCFKVNNKWYYFNLTSDIMHIQTGMKTRSFAISQERIKQKLYNKNPEYNKLYHLYRMNRENGNQEFSEISQEELRKWDNEFGFTYKGLYTNDIMEMIKNDTNNIELMQELFETDKEDEIVQKKFEFVMDKMGIIRNNMKIGNVEAREYYIKLVNKAFSKEEIQKYLRLCESFIEKDGERKFRNVVIIKKQNENIYYLYNPETMTYEKTDVRELIKTNLKFHNIQKQRIDPISEFVNNIESENKKEELEK